MEDQNIFNQLKLLQQQISMLTIPDMKKKLKFTKQIFFKHANKPGRWLYKLRKQTEKKITKICEGNKTHMDNKNIQRLFGDLIYRSSKKFHRNK